MPDISERQFGEEHAKKVTELKGSDPSKYWSVAHPEPGSTSHPIADGPGAERKGYVSFKADEHAVNIGGIVQVPGYHGVVKGAMEAADRLHPEHPQKLDAFDGHLPAMYAKHGFQETGRMKFDPKYAPPEWDEKVHGRPDVVEMARPAAQGSLFPDTHPTTPPAGRKKRTPLGRQFGGTVPAVVPGQQTIPGLTTTGSAGSAAPAQ